MTIYKHVNKHAVYMCNQDLVYRFTLLKFI